MRVTVPDHPLIAHKLTVLRDGRTDAPTFRRLVDELVTLLAYEATRNLRVQQVDVITPLAPTRGVRLAMPRPLIVPILRAGLGMLDGISRLMPTAEVGFLGMVRDEVTLTASTYTARLPEVLTGRQVFLLDPMLATGGTLAQAVGLVLARGASDVTIVSLVASSEGIETLREAVADSHERVSIVTAAVDHELNEQGYIVPGLGDAGDRLYGLA
jgi:uracil phosphoribosyltransferase